MVALKPKLQEELSRGPLDEAFGNSENRSGLGVSLRVTGVG